MSNVMTFRMCLRELCFRLLIFNELDLNHLVSMFLNLCFIMTIKTQK